ncbi:Breast cancer 2, early onset [Terramyces sp. JEL0728]|nr:Breast cancer 2, early onset [Terramyces sp. JEL0728]
MSKEFKQPLKTPQRELQWSPSMETPVHSNQDTPGTLMSKLRGEEPSPIFEIKKRKLGPRLGAGSATSTRYEKFNQNMLSTSISNDQSSYIQNLKSIKELKKKHLKRKALQEIDAQVPSLQDLNAQKRSSNVQNPISKERDTHTPVIKSKADTIIFEKVNDGVPMDSIDLSPTIAKSFPVTPIVIKVDSSVDIPDNLSIDLSTAEPLENQTQPISQRESIEKTAKEVLGQMIDDDDSLTEIESDSQPEKINSTPTDVKLETVSLKFKGMFMPVDTPDMESPFVVDPAIQQTTTPKTNRDSKPSSNVSSESKSCKSFKFTSQVININSDAIKKSFTITAAESEIKVTSYAANIAGKINPETRGIMFGMSTGAALTPNHVGNSIANVESCSAEISTSITPKPLKIQETTADAKRNVDEALVSETNSLMEDTDNSLSPVLCANEFSLQNIMSDPAIKEAKVQSAVAIASQDSSTQSIEDYSNIFQIASKDSYNLEKEDSTVDEASMDGSIVSSKNDTEMMQQDTTPKQTVSKTTDKIKAAPEFPISQYTSTEELDVFYKIIDAPSGLNTPAKPSIHNTPIATTVTPTRNSPSNQINHPPKTSGIASLRLGKLPETQEYLDLGVPTQILAGMSLHIADELSQREIEEYDDTFGSQFYTNISLTQITKAGDAVELVGITTGNGNPIQTSVQAKEIGQQLFKLEEDLDNIETEQMNISRKGIDNLFKPKILNESDFRVTGEQAAAGKNLLHLCDTPKHSEPNYSEKDQAGNLEFTGFITAGGRKLEAKKESLWKVQKMIEEVQSKVQSKVANKEEQVEDAERKDTSTTLFGNHLEETLDHASADLFDSQVLVFDSSGNVPSKKLASGDKIIESSIEKKLKDLPKPNSCDSEIPNLGGFSTAGGRVLPIPVRSAYLHVNQLLDDIDVRMEDDIKKREVFSETPKVLIDNGDQHGNTLNGGFSTALGRELPKPSKESFLAISKLFTEEQNDELSKGSKSDLKTPIHLSTSFRPISEPSKLHHRKSKRFEDEIESPKKRRSFGGFHAKLDFVTPDSHLQNTAHTFAKREFEATPVKPFKSPVILQPFSAKKTPTLAIKSILRNTPFKKPSITPVAQRRIKNSKNTPGAQQIEVFDTKKQGNALSLKDAFPEIPMLRILESDRWNFKNVVDQLLYRYEIEVNQAKRSPLKAVVEGDAPANRHMVLFISKLQRVNDALIIKVSDGWYSVPAEFDECLVALSNLGKLFVGQKLHVQAAKMSLGDPCSVLDASFSNRRIKIFANSTRRAEWHVSLGYQPTTFYPVKLSSILENGGMITLIDIVVQRIYQTEHIERLSDGTVVIRDNKEEEQEQYAWQERNRKAFNKGMEKYESGNCDIAIDETNSETIHQSLKDYACSLVPPRNVQTSTTIKVSDYPCQLSETVLENCSSACISLAGRISDLEEGKRFRFYQLLPKGKIGSHSKTLKSISTTRHTPMPLNNSVEQIYEQRRLDKCIDLPSKKPRDDVDIALMVQGNCHAHLELVVKKEYQTASGTKYQIELSCCDETGNAILHGQVTLKKLEYLKKSEFYLFKDLEYLYYKDAPQLKIVGHTVIGTSLVAPYKHTNSMETLRKYFQ